MMVFFKTTNSRLITKQNLISDEEERTPIFLSQVNVDADGKFLDGVSNLSMTTAFDKALNKFFILDTTRSLYGAILVYVCTNVCGKCPEFYSFCSWLQQHTEPLEENWVCQYNKLLEQCRDDRIVMFSCYDEEDEKLLRLFREVRDYWEAVMEHEFCVCLWSGMFVATVCWLEVRVEYQLVKEIYLHPVSELKENIEIKLTDNEHKMWWTRALAEFRILNNGDQWWLSLREYFIASGRLLQTMIVRESDFHENPIHYMLEDVYSAQSVSERVGSWIVHYLVELSFKFSHCQYYSILPLIDKILGMSDEIQKIRDANVCYWVVKACNILAVNRLAIWRYVSKWDSYVGIYVRNNNVGAMPSFC